MIRNHRVLALTPARGGSKGLPGKNLRPLCGKPLVAWPVDLARASKYIDRVVVSTDSDEIAEVARRHGATVSVRPAELAGDSVIVADVARQVLADLESRGERFDYVVLLEATSPMRTLEMVDGCIEQMVEAGVDSIATFHESDPPPTRLGKIEGGLATTFLDGADPWLPRQLQPQAFQLNGMVYGFKVSTFFEDGSNTLFVGRGAARITQARCVDIDTLEDFEIAEMLLGKRHEHT